MPTLTDRQLVQAALRGEADPFATLAEKYAESVYALSYARLLHHADAEDITQETFLRAYEKLGQLRQLDRFESWVHRITMTLTYDRLRQRARETPMDTQRLLRDHPADVDEYAALERETDAALLVPEALRTLPADLRDAFVMRHMTEASYATIARRLHISPVAAERRVQRAKDRLRQYFRRRDDAHAMRSLAVASPMGEGFLARIHDAWRTGSPPSSYATATSASPPTLGVIAAGVATTLALFAGVYGAQARRVHWGDLRREGSLRYVEQVAGAPSPASTPRAASEPGRSRELIREGEELLGWLPLEPNNDTTTPVPGGGVASGHGATAILGNDFGAFKPIEPASGEVTLAMDVRALRTAYHSQLGFVLDHYPLGVPLLLKTPVNQWRYRDYVGRMTAVTLRPVEETWTRVKIVYRTWNAIYDLAIDGRWVAREARLDPSRIGLPVTGVYIKSGRGGIGEPLYFRRMRLSVREPTIDEMRARQEAFPPLAEAARAFDAVFLNGGELNGRPVPEGAATIAVKPGEDISGRVDVTVHNEHESTAVFPVIQAPTWKDHERGYRVVADTVGTGVTRLAVMVDEVAPSRPGTYHLLIAAAAEAGPAFVASGTNWPMGSPVWNNGTDIAHWSDSLIREAIMTGTVVAPWLGKNGETAPIAVAATAVRVVVAD